jgi:hypothetical protein
MRNEVFWSGDSSQLSIVGQCFVKSLICTINYKFYVSSPTYLQMCSYKMYYVVHAFPNLSRAAIHLGTCAHLVANKCRKSFQEMKNMVANEVCCTPIATTSAIVLSTNKTFFSCHLFNEDGQGLVELLNDEKPNRILLKFVLLCSPNICNLILSLKHCLGNSSSINYILKLKALFG